MIIVKKSLVISKIASLQICGEEILKIFVKVRLKTPQLRYDIKPNETSMITLEEDNG